jgi:hypothetical protein
MADVAAHALHDSLMVACVLAAKQPLHPRPTQQAKFVVRERLAGSGAPVSWSAALRRRSLGGVAPSAVSSCRPGGCAVSGYRLSGSRRSRAHDLFQGAEASRGRVGDSLEG